MVLGLGKGGDRPSSVDGKDWKWPGIPPPMGTHHPGSRLRRTESFDLAMDTKPASPFARYRSEVPFNSWHDQQASLNFNLGPKQLTAAERRAESCQEGLAPGNDVVKNPHDEYDEQEGRSLKKLLHFRSAVQSKAKSIVWHDVARVSPHRDTDMFDRNCQTRGG